MNSDLKKYATPDGEAHQARRRDGQFWGRPPDIPHARQRPPHTPHTRALEPDLTSRRRDKFAARCQSGTAGTAPQQDDRTTPRAGEANGKWLPPIGRSRATPADLGHRTPRRSDHARNKVTRRQPGFSPALSRNNQAPHRHHAPIRPNRPRECEPNARSLSLQVYSCREFPI